MDKHLDEEAISAEIMSYVKNRIYNYAVLIDGDWGTGKTYFIQKSLIPNLEKSGYMPIYISLYGINSTDTVSQKIALSLLTNKIPADKKSIARERSLDPIQKAEKYWLMDDLEVEAIYTELSNCIETHNYTLIELFKILSFAHKLSEIGFTVDVDQYFQKVYNAINNMEPLSKEQMRYFELSMFDGSFLSQDSPCFSAFKQQCNELLALMEEKSSNRDDLQLDSILKEKLHWGHKLYEYVFEKRDAFLSERAFLSKFNIDIVVDKLQNSPPDDWQDFRHCLSAVYNFSNLRDYYSNDLKNAIDLKEKLESTVLPTKILNNLHKKWLVTDLQEIINKLTPQSPNDKGMANDMGSDTPDSQKV